MTDGGFQERIAEKRISLDATVSQMENVRVRFVSAIAAFAASWWNERARGEVERNHAVTDKLTDSDLGQLKAEVRALADEAEKHAGQVFVGADAWWHLRKDLTAPVSDSMAYFYSVSGRAGPRPLEKPFRLLLGRLGPILQKHGYMPRVPAHAPTEYAFYADWPAGLTPLVEEYAKYLRSAEALVREISAVEDEEKRTRSKKRWDSA